MALASVAWQLKAACTNVSNIRFFPSKSSGETTKGADQEDGILKQDIELLNMCRSCPVNPECFHMGYTGGDYGIWGGTSTKFRKQLQVFLRHKGIQKRNITVDELDVQRKHFQKMLEEVSAKWNKKSSGIKSKA